ncbi:MAG: molybdopterin converting factor subunit 1 [Acidocella sp. 20-61-6]|nr:MAG: molybdopterin converting factor subunit 1 [Acidocella sp. 20-61-6]
MKLLYFAWLREKIGLSEEDVMLPENLRSVADLVEWLRGRGPGYQAAFAQTKLVRCAIDQDFAQADSSIAGATEIAFFPPVTGG